MSAPPQDEPVLGDRLSAFAGVLVEDIRHMVETRTLYTVRDQDWRLEITADQVELRLLFVLVNPA